MAATEQLLQQLVRICATEFGGDSSFQRSGFAELCFPSYDLDEFHDILGRGLGGDTAGLTSVPRVQIMDEPNIKHTTKFILDAAQMHQVACYALPKQLAHRRWKRTFSLARDGNSFEACMQKLKGEKETLLVVKTMQGEVFGGYSDAPWEQDTFAYHGGDNTKLFSFVDKIVRNQSSRSLHSIDDSVHSCASSTDMQNCDSRDDCEEKTGKKRAMRVYSWSGLNRDFQYCDSSRTLLAFGGGGARFGLSIERNFKMGSTGPCDTFTNEKLGNEENFRVMDVEIWTFVAVEETCCSILCCQQAPTTVPAEDTNWIPPVRLVRERVRPEKFILNQAQLDQIARYVLPQTIAACRWKRAYSLARDGDSFDTCLHKTRKERRSLMVIRTEDNQIFGGYADSPWKAFHCNYYGSAQACLWKFTSDDDQDPASPIQGMQPVGPDQIKVFKWAGLNRYIQYCDITHRILAFGGGGESGSFGLCVENEFQTGSTGPCATFGNEPLCDQEHFKIVDLEIWGFLTGEF